MDVSDQLNHSEEVNRLNDVSLASNEPSKLSDTTIIESLAMLTKHLLPTNTNPSNPNTADNAQSIQEEFLQFKLRTKKLLEQLFDKLDERNQYIDNLEKNFENAQKDLALKEAKLNKLTSYIESFIEKCTRDADERVKSVTNDLKTIVREKHGVEKMVYKLTAENKKLKDEIQLLRIAESGTANSAAAKAHMTDMIYENEDLKEKIAQLEEDLSNVKLQRDAEMMSVMHLIREFSNNLG